MDKGSLYEPREGRRIIVGNYEIAGALYPPPLALPREP